MSTAQLTEAGDELQLTAFATLSRLIKAETNPDRLEKLLALALKSRTTTRQQAIPPSPAKRERVAESARPGGGAMRTTSPLSTPTPLPNRPTPNDVSEVHEEDSPGDLLPLSPPPTFTLMTDAEYLTLERQIGPVEAHRRRLIRAHLVANQNRRDANSS